MGRFAHLVDSEEGLESFKARYRIPPRVAIRYCKEGQWFEERQEGEVVIPMITFIEVRIRIPMGTVTRDYLRPHRLALTQCAPNMFRSLGCVNALNERMGLNLTHHDVNRIYNLHHLTRQGYYLKSRYPEVRLIQYLPDSNKGLKKDFLIISGEWHDGLPCPTREGKPTRYKFIISKLSPFLFLFFMFVHKASFDLHDFFLKMFFVSPYGFTDRNTAIPNFNLVNQPSLDKITKA